MAACVIGRVRDCVHCSSTKDMLQLEELNFRVTVNFVHLVESLRWPRGELRAKCRLWNKSIALTKPILGVT